MVAPFALLSPFSCTWSAFIKMATDKLLRSHGAELICSANLSSSSIALHKDMLQSEHRRFLILCEYMRQRRQQGVKRDERASGLDLIDFAVGHQVQIAIKQVTVHPFQWQSFLASFGNDSQNRSAFLHFAHLSVLAIGLTSCPSPCMQLSCTRSTMAVPLFCGSRRVDNPMFAHVERASVT